MTAEQLTRLAREAETRLAALAACSQPGPGVTRLPFTPEHLGAMDMLSAQMETAGLSVRTDAAGTLIGRLEGPRGAPTLLLGSHQDSVPEGGAYDGIMGVVLPILALETLRDEGIALPFAVEVLAFADEEGVRFPTALLGPRALAGTFDRQVLDMVDDDGMRLADAMSLFGLDPARIPAVARAREDVLAYVETHIEQGPVLEAHDQPLGVVTAICGIERHMVTITGETGHAGTLPMAMRRDALVGAAAILGEVDRLARNTPGLLGTVGTLKVAPGAVNAVPREVRMSVELRAPDDPTREAAGRSIEAFAHAVCAEKGLSLDMRRTYQQAATPCDPALAERLSGAIAEMTGQAAPRLPSGATHDASAMADLCPVAMLFVRCRGGVSHSPEEKASGEDMARAVATLVAFLKAPGLRAKH